MGTIYDITMNREAALQWMNLSLSDTDLATWWAGHSLDYQAFWRDWIVNQGNVVYDIYSGYWDFFYDYFYAATLSEIPATGDIHLRISHCTFGAEVLIARWLSAAGLSGNEVYLEDFTLSANMDSHSSDISFDGVADYSLRAVKSSLSSGNEGAWAWQPQKIDYVPSWSSYIYHHSDFDPYANSTYTSWNAGDAASSWGGPVGYDTTPTVFNLMDYMTLTIELPKGSDVPFYLGQPVPDGSIIAARQGNVANYTSLEYNGTATLGYTEPMLDAWYNNVSQTLSLTGPMTFGDPTSSIPLEHGLPWIEIASVVNQPPNTPPHASFTVAPDHGDMKTIFSFDASGSSDKESSIQYRWDWESDGIWDTGWAQNPIAKHSYNHFGIYSARLQVKDAGNLTDDCVRQVSVGLTVTMKGNQKASIAQWTYTPRFSGEFVLMVDNNGLRTVKLGVDDITNGTPEGVAYMRMPLRNLTGVYAMDSFYVVAGHEYLFTLTPGGHKGESALVYGTQNLSTLVAQFTMTVNSLNVYTDASAMMNGNIVDYIWYWGDGTYSSGMTASHTYASIGTWAVTLTVSDVFGRWATVTHVLTVS